MGGGAAAVTADDVHEVVDAAVSALVARRDRDWHVPAGTLEWSCWETLEHLSESLFFYAMQLIPVRDEITGSYPFDYAARRPGGPEGALFARPSEGSAGVLRILNACGGLLVSTVRTAPPGHRARHVWGHSDAEGFAAMGVVEVVAHVHDVAGALAIDWAPPEDLCDRSLARLFPDAPTGTDRLQTLLWATGRAELPGHPRLEDWRWYGEPR